MNSFLDLSIDPRILQAINLCGYTAPTEIQAKSIPIILSGKDMIGATETGSGKTAAFVIPALHRLAKDKKQVKIRVLILAPTRELASQITQAINKYGKFLKIWSTSIIGGTSYREQERALSRPNDILVATPGRLLDHIKNKRIDLSQIQMLVLDEADRMLDMGFEYEVRSIINALPQQKQTLLFTATLDPKLIKSMSHLLSQPEIINLSKPKMVPHKIAQKLFIASNPQQKITFLENLINEESIFKGLIFASTKIGADQIAAHLRVKGHNVLALHGDMKQYIRKKSLDKLTTGKIQFLVATNIAARGIDIKDISHVINYDLPRCTEDYIHRVGRTGRAGQPGIAITIALRNEKKYIFALEQQIGAKLQLINFNGEPEIRRFEEPPPPHPQSISRKREKRVGDFASTSARKWELKRKKEAFSRKRRKKGE
jgi:superfamily II DNA/RNA helicase